MRKMDEMEQTIAHKSIKISWGVGIVLLILYSLYRTVMDQTLPVTFLFLLIMMIIYHLATILYRRKMGDGSATRLLIMVSVVFILGLAAGLWAGLFH